MAGRRLSLPRPERAAATLTGPGSPVVRAVDGIGLREGSTAHLNGGRRRPGLSRNKRIVRVGDDHRRARLVLERQTALRTAPP